MVSAAEDQGASLLAAAAAATAGAVAKAAESAAAKGSDATELEGIGVEAAEAAMAAKQQAAVAAAAMAEDGGGVAGGAEPAAARSSAAPAEGPSSLRLFVRGLGSLGEHHLRDYFQKFGEVLEATLVRDKKTQRPRGMGFVTLQPRGEGASSCASMAEEIAGEVHTVNGVEVEVQEALPKPEKEDKETGSGSQGGAPPLAHEGQTSPSAAAAVAAGPPQQEEATESAPAAQALAQAQWQMHYLAMAINASVPEVSGPHEGPPFKKAAPARPPASLGGLRGASAAR